MLLSLENILVIKSFETGLLIKQDIAGVELYLQFEKGKDWFEYAFQQDNMVHPIDGAYYDITFELESNYWAKGKRYFTNAVLHSIDLS